MSNIDYPKEILESLEDYNIDIRDFMPGHGSGAKLLLDFNEIKGMEQVEGIILKGREIKNGIVADIIIKEGTKIDDPVHLCFGVNKATGTQEIFSRIIAEDNTEVSIQAHCSFPNADGLVHKMFGHFYIGKNCKFTYNETHYHGEKSGAFVAPVGYMYVGENSIFENNFNLTKGTPGKVKIMIDIYAMKNSVIKSTIRAFGKSKNDSIRIRDSIFLEGENAIAKNREVMGATNPADADEGTIRKDFALSIGENSVHGSDAPETAAEEIAFFFSGLELVG